MGLAIHLLFLLGLALNVLTNDVQLTVIPFSSFRLGRLEPARLRKENFHYLLADVGDRVDVA
jgi:hypothetical protein